MDAEINYKHQNHLNNLDYERIKAFHTQNYIKYAELCDKLGMKPESNEFYELGKLEKEMSNRNIYKL